MNETYGFKSFVARESIHSKMAMKVLPACTTAGTLADSE
jgi:hypothetical protein